MINTAALVGLSCLVCVMQPEQKVAVEPASAVKLLEEAYQRWPSAEIRFKHSSVVSGDNLDSFLKQLNATPGLTKTTHPESKADCYDLSRGRVLMDRDGNVRIESERVAIGKGWAPVLVPKNYKLWSAQESAVFNKGGEDEAEVREIYLHDRESRLAARKKGQLTQEFLKALDCFPGLVAWVRDSARCAQDLRVGVSTRADEIDILSDELGLQFSIERTTGALRSVDFLAPTGQRWGWRFEGEIGDSAFPAKHPRLEIRYFSQNGGPRQSGDLFTYESLRVIEPPADALFHWTSVAPFAFKTADKVVVDSKGVVDAARTQRRLDRQPPVLKSESPPPANTSAPSTIGRPWYTAAIIVFVAVVGIFIRSRMG